LTRSAMASRGQVLPGAAAAPARVGGHARQSVLTGNIRPLAEVKLTALGCAPCLSRLPVPAFPARPTAA
jgi:hypothetical protein